MSRKSWRLLIFGVLLFVPLAFAFTITQPQVAAGFASAPNDGVNDLTTQQVTNTAAYFWSFAAKFVCGYQTPSTAQSIGEPPVKTGNYATEINIHNYNYRNISLRKKIVLLVDRGQVIGREPAAQQPRAFMKADMGPDFGMLDDCNALWEALYPTTPPPSPMPLIIGYLVIISPLDLDVDVVYTAAAPGTLVDKETGIAIDVTRVTGKRVFVPAGALP